MKVSVRVTPNARKERFEKTAADEFTASIKEKPQRNEANDRVQRLLASHYNVPVTSVRFLTGVRAKKKTFEIAG